jgi:hypothetical protein
VKCLGPDWTVPARRRVVGFSNAFTDGFPPHPATLIRFPGR